MEGRRLRSFVLRPGDPGAFIGCVWIAICLVCACAAFSYQNWRHEETTRVVADRSHAARQAAERVLSVLKDAERGQRGYLLTGNPALLEPFDMARGRLDVQLTRLDQALPANADVAAIKPLVEQDLAHLDEAIALSRRGRTAAALEPARFDTGDAILGDIQHLVERIQADQRARLSEVIAAEPRLTPFATAILGVIGFAMLLAATGWLLRTRSAALRKLQEAAHLTRTFGLSQGLVRRLDGRIMRWDAGNERLYGYTSETAIGRLADDLLKTVFPKPLADIEADLLRDGWWDGELRQQRQDGSVIVVKSHWAIHEAAPDAERCVIEINSDITTLKAVEAELRSSTLKLELALRAGGMGVWECVRGDWPRSMDVMTWNARQFGLYGLEARDGEISVEAFIRRVHPEDRAAINDGVEAALLEEGRVFDQEYRILLPDGGIRWLRGCGQAVFDPEGRALRMVGLNFDVTTARAAEDRLRESERMFHTMTDAMPQMVWSALPDGQNTYVNQRWYEVTGARPEEGIAAYAWTDRLHPDEVEEVHERWAHSVATGEPYEMEHRFMCKGGSYMWLLSRAMPVRDADGTIVNWFGTSTDIQETVSAREIIARSNEALEQLVAERTRDLQEAQAKLVHAEKVKALGELAGGIAHDFNNVLQTIQAGAEFIESFADDVESVVQQAEQILKDADRGSRITKRLLAFAHKSDKRADKIDVGALLADMGDMLRHTLGSGIVVSVDVSSGLPPMRADHAELEAVLVNLATNARDAMASSGTLRFAATAKQLDDDRVTRLGAGAKPGCYVRLSVRDNGAGMDAATLARVTEPFFTTKPRGQGTGLGLSMARGFAERSGGGLVIESAPGRGTEVTLWIPAAEAAQGYAAPDDRTGTVGALWRVRLLVVDDDEGVRETVADQMDASGFVSLRASGAAEALALLDAGEDVDLIVCDLFMPGMDGLGLIREAQRRRPELPAILITGGTFNAAEIEAEAAGRGRIALVRKPIDDHALAARVLATLESQVVA